MSVQRTSISTPQSAAGIIGISSTTNIGGWKFQPKWVVVTAVAVVVVVKAVSILMGAKNL
jgi:preprotein translocase subunit Sec61beta